MRNLLAFVGAMIVTLAVVGWYQNWFQFRTTSGLDGNRNISIDIDSKKVADDVNKTEHNLQHFIEEKSKEAKTSPPATAPVKVPVIEVKKEQGKDASYQLNLFGPAGRN